jgi:DNA/RNA endonuclease YhcR with UshA esterase domain
MSDCPSCGRYVGPYDACPYCGAALGGRTSTRRLKIAALTLALGGLALLWLLATRSDVSTVEIGQANAMMNMAYVRVQGLVVRPPSYDPESHYLSFWLRDNTGELRVSVYRSETQALIAQERIPALGDQVSVQGTLRVREDSIALTLNVPKHLEIQRAEPLARSIGAITAGDEFTPLRVHAQVRGVRIPYPGLTLIALRDETGEIELAVPESVTALDGELPLLDVGQSVEVVAPVSLYKDAPQLSLAHVADLSLLPETLSIAPELPIGQVNGDLIERWLTVSGRVTGVSPFSAGIKYTLQDDSGQITLLLWQSLYEQLSAPKDLAVGATLRVQGQVSEYWGEMEIAPQLPEDLSVLAPPPQPTPTLRAEPTRLSGSIELTEVSSQAQDEAASPTPQPTPAPTRQPTPTLTAIVLPGPTTVPTRQPTPTPAPTPTLTPSPTASATPSPTLSPTPAVVVQPIGSLSAAHAGQEVTVSGRVVDTASFAQGFKFTLDDGSGQIVLLMWQNVYDDCWDAPQLNLNATVQAEGEVGEFEGALQVTPNFGGDVKVTVPGNPFAAQQAIGSINAYLGQRVTLVGEILRVEGTGSGAKIFVGDETGETLVFIWNNVLERIPNNQALGTPGTRVRVAGVVQEYQGNLEVVPVLPYDVEIRD